MRRRTLADRIYAGLLWAMTALVIWAIILGLMEQHRADQWRDLALRQSRTLKACGEVIDEYDKRNGTLLHQRPTDEEL